MDKIITKNYNLAKTISIDIEVAINIAQNRKHIKKYGIIQKMVVHIFYMMNTKKIFFAFNNINGSFLSKTMDKKIKKIINNIMEE